MLDFGFSYIGLIALLMLYIPNWIWVNHKPKDYEIYALGENRVLLALERIGQVAVTVFALVSANLNIYELTPWIIWLILAFLVLIFYEIAWIRYFKSTRTMSDFYQSFLGIPVPLATLPIVGFLLLGIYGMSMPLIISSIILGIGHIGIHLNHLKEVRSL